MNQSIIEHKANMYYVELREDYLLICQNCTFKKDGKSKASPYCKAFILAILEHWTNDKRGKGEGLSVYMSYSQWIKGMYGMFGRTVIIDSIEELMGEGLISREAYKMFGRDTFKYLLNTGEINRRMRALPERNPEETHPNLDPSTSKPDPSTSKRVTSSQVNGSHLLVDTYPSTSNHNIESNIETNIDSDRESVNAATPPQDTHPSFSNSSSSREQVADRAAPTPQARSSAEAATSAPDAPRTPDSPPFPPQGVRGVFPQDTNRVGPPVAEDKAQVNGQAYPWMTMLDQWDKDYNGGRRSKRDSLTLRHAREWMVEMNLTYQDAQTVRRKIIEHNLHRGKPITFTMVYDHSEWLGEIPKANVPATSSALMPPRVKTREELRREAY